MMTTILDSETVIGKCHSPGKDEERWRFAEPEYATVLAHTTASINGHRGMLRVEQHCYLRRGGELPDQPWIKPEVLLEPAIGPQERMIDLAEQLHERFVNRVREQFPEEYMV